MEYLPFGETLVDEHQNSYNSPFKFNAKELDEESGNYYYGARYYNSKFSTWLSVDPLAEKYMSFSPYNYTLNNPINLIDPDGRSVEDDYKLVDGEVVWWRERAGEDRLYIDDKFESFDYDFLCDAGNILEDGFDTGNVIDGIKLARFISFNEESYQTGNHSELSGFGYTTNLVETEASRLRILPYDKASVDYDGIDGNVIGMHSGTDFKLNSDGVESKYSIFQPGTFIKFAFHTHPTAFNASSKFLNNGIGIPSDADLNIATNNLLYFNIDIPYYVFGSKVQKRTGYNSTVYRGIPYGRERFDKGILFRFNF